MLILTNLLDERLTEISLVVGIVGSVLALPIVKALPAWFRKHRQKKTDRLTAAVEKATKPLIKAYEREHKALIDKIAEQDETSLSILHDRIYQDGKQMIDNGEASIDDIDNFIHLYERYRKLGGNGTGEVMNSRVMNLPLKHETNTLVQEAEALHKEREAQNN